MLHASLEQKWQEIRVEVVDSPVYFWLSLASAVDTVDRQETCKPGDMNLRPLGDGWEAEVSWQSSIWTRKTHGYRFQGGRLEHWVEVEGTGTLSELTYLSGTVDGEERGSLPGFGAVYPGMPNFIDKPYSHPSEFVAISAGNVTELWGSALNGGPLMFAFGEHGQPGWLVAGLHCRPGEYQFQTMAFNKQRPQALATHDNIIGTQAITLEYGGQVEIDGTWRSPTLVLFDAGTAAEGLQRYCEGVRDGGFAPQPASQPCDWWADPIFCTWHEQVALGQLGFSGSLEGREALEASTESFDKITQANASRWLDIFERHDIRFGTIILDAKWQDETRGGNHVHTGRFADLRGFIDDRHGRGQHVVLWMLAWDTSDLPAEWCVLQDGEPVMADPTNPDYRDYVQSMMHRMLSDDPGCYNGDGLKIDGTNVLPGSPGLRSHGGLYGFELLHAYFKLVYDAAKKAKPEALVSIFGGNPLFADCCDMVRAGDLYSFRADPLHTLRWRAETIAAALPHALIDTDGTWHFTLREDLSALLEAQSRLGVPCVYQAEHLMQSRAFTPHRIRKLTDEDYDVIRTVLADYDKRRRTA